MPIPTYTYNTPYEAVSDMERDLGHAEHLTLALRKIAESLEDHDGLAVNVLVNDIADDIVTLWKKRDALLGLLQKVEPGHRRLPETV